MSALAAATQALQAKKEEYAAILTEIQCLIERKAAGEAGSLALSVTSVHAVSASAPALEDVQVAYAVEGAEAGEAATGSCALSEKVSIKLQSKDVTIRFTGSYRSSPAPPAPAAEVGTGAEAEAEAEAGEVTPIAEGDAGAAGSSAEETRVSFTAVFDCKEAPEDTSLTCDLETTCSTLVFRIQAGFDTLDGSLASKQREIEENEAECKRLAQAIREAAMSGSAGSSSSSATSPSSSPKKTKGASSKKPKAAAAGAAAAAAADPNSLSARAAFFAKVAAANIGTAGELLSHSRAYWLWGLASVAIYFYGDYASL